VLIKSDGYPTYHLANVVDDHLMEISHVIRGEEWLPSTPKHVLLYKFFDWQPPQFAHLPLLLNKDRSKLSKRQGDVAVEDYQKKGILTQALVNYVALLGWNKGDDQEIFSLDELCEHFTLDRVNKSGAVFDIEKLVWMNGQYIRNLPDAKYLELTLDWLDKSGISKGNVETNKQILLAVRNHLSQISDLNEATEVFFNEKLRFTPEAEELIKQANSLNIFRLMLNKIQGVAELTLDNFKEIMKEVQTESGAKGKELWMPVRAGITGQTSGPELPVVLSVIGKERVLGFLKQSIQIAEQG
jgi:nondiscriminating glutamyl-tRNA synthetase